jgi:hypothetical protein
MGSREMRDWYAVDESGRANPAHLQKYPGGQLAHTKRLKRKQACVSNASSSPAMQRLSLRGGIFQLTTKRMRLKPLFARRAVQLEAASTHIARVPQTWPQNPGNGQCHVLRDSN